MLKTRNVNFTPFIDTDLNIKNENLKKDVKEFFKDSSTHKIYCVNKAYGCRLGVLGLSALSLSNYIEEHTTYKTLSKVIKNFSYLTSIINRMIPILNYGVYDIKDINIENVYHNNNLSITSMFTFDNLLMTKYYDSGCVIYSNVASHSNGFISFNKSGNVNSNSGITWSYFDTGILVIIVEMLDPQYVPNMNILRFVNNMLNQYKNLSITYICIEDQSGLSIEELNTIDHKVTVISPKLANNFQTIIEHVDEVVEVVDVVDTKIVVIDEYFVHKNCEKDEKDEKDENIDKDCDEYTMI